MDHKKKLEEAKRLYETANADQRYVLESLFPELRESEDERIRKALIKYLDALDDDETRYGVAFKDMCAWLEKQGEKKFAWGEEDELSLKQAIYVCHQNGYTAVENWLKSLEQRIKER